MTPWARKELPDAPGLASVLMRSLMANRHAFRNHLQVDDLLLVPPIPPGIGFLDWHRHGELMDAGYRWARATLQERTMAAQSK
jgi:NTE family protein